MSDTVTESSQSKPQPTGRDIRLKDIEALEKKKTQHMVSSDSSLPSFEGNGNSPSLSTSVATHLLKLMQEVTKSEVNPNTVKAACSCAHQMIELMKLNIKLKDMK